MEFLRETELEKYMLNKLTEVVREYVYKPIDSRHRKTVMVFTGDRYRPIDIITRFVNVKKK